jgi:hypothetical protein
LIRTLSEDEQERNESEPKKMPLATMGGAAGRVVVAGLLLVTISGLRLAGQQKDTASGLSSAGRNW